MQEIRFPLNVGVAGHCAMSGEPVNIPEAYKDPRFNPEVDRQTGYVTKNILCIPIKNIEGKIVGVTQMINKAEGRFGPDDEKLLEAFSSQGEHNQCVLIQLKT
jgi:adenylate cyclase